MSTDFNLIDVTSPFMEPESDRPTVTTVKVYRNFWWVCKDGDPKQALMYRIRHPQCNMNKAIVDSLLKGDKDMSGIENLQVVQLPIAYIYFNLRHYMS